MKSVLIICLIGGFGLNCKARHEFSNLSDCEIAKDYALKFYGFAYCEEREMTLWEKIRP